MAKAPIEIKSLARSYTDSAIKTLAGIMQQSEAAPAARVAAAQALLDRGWGKPTQTIEANVKRSTSDLSDAELIAIAEDGSEGVASSEVSPSKPH